MCVFKAALPRDTRLAGGEGRDGQVWGSASASDQTKQAAEGVGRAAFVRVYLSAAISRTLQIEWRLLDTRLIPLKTSNGQKLHQQPPSTLRGYCINLPCRHPTHALEHIHIYARIYIHVRCEYIETDVCSLLYLRATFSRYQLVYHPSRLPPRLSPLPLSSWKRRDAARARVHRDERTRSRFFSLLFHSSSPLPVHRQPSIEETKGKSFRRLYYRNTNVKNLCNFSRHRRPSG